jgi:glycine cleavage system H protein|tara:strand:+ start:3451 stop:3840 length:390 start_codon:yes stop_codon:yes gene_type:complete
MSEIPSELRYLSTHEWVRIDENGDAIVGITDHAQQALGDMVFIELPEVGSELAAGDEAGVVESVKAASDIYSPISGEVIAVNEALEDAPETVNNDPYTDGWLFKLSPRDEGELEELLDSDAYAEKLEDA